MAKIVILDRSGLPDSIALRQLVGQHQLEVHQNTSEAQLSERLDGAEIAVLSKVAIDEHALKSAPSLQHIAVFATGTNIIDHQACQRYGVTISNIPSYAATTVAEHVINVSLTLRRELVNYRNKVIQGEWQKSPSFCLFDKAVKGLHGATMGIIGYGEIGRKTGELARALGMKVIVLERSSITDPAIEQVGFHELITTSDVISLHCSLNPSTNGLIGQDELAAMKPEAILINTARGGIVDEGALVNAIQQQVIGGTAVDVLAEEPPKDHSPLLRIAQLDNVIITPHISWTDQRAMQHLANTLMDNIEAYLRGNPQNLVSL